MAAETRTKHVVVLVKTSATLGPLPVGSQFEIPIRNGCPEQALEARAWRLFQRERPDENPVCWDIEEVR